MNISSMSFFLILTMVSKLSYAHEFWLEPHFRVNENTISISARVGPGWPGVQSIRSLGMVDFIKLYNGNELGEDLKGRDNSYVFGHFKKNTGSTQLVLLKTNNFKLNLSAQDFNQYLKEEGLNDALLYREKYNLNDSDSVELFYRISKTYSQFNNDNSFNRNLNLPFEITLLTNPLTYKINTPFLLRVTQNGVPVVGKQIKAQEKHNKRTYITKTDEKGIAEFNLNKNGFWLFSSVLIEPLYHSEAQWQSTWTSLTLNI